MLLELTDRHKVERDGRDGWKCGLVFITQRQFRLRRERHLVVIVQRRIAFVSSLQRRFTQVVHLHDNTSGES